MTRIKRLHLATTELHGCSTHEGAYRVVVDAAVDVLGFDWCCLGEADDGRGIPAADREAVFEMGFSTKDDGTGFGLAIVDTIAEAHGWSVSVADGEAGGARFDVRTDGATPS